MLTEENAKMFAVSSAKAGGALSALIEATDEDGNRILNSKTLGEPCDACKKTGDPYTCNHNLYELAEWKSARKQQRIMSVYKSAGMEHIMDAELFNKHTDEMYPTFKESLYHYMFCETPLGLETSELEVIYVGVDPASGGPSEFAMVAMGFSSNSTYKFQASHFPLHSHPRSPPSSSPPSTIFFFSITLHYSFLLFFPLFSCVVGLLASVPSISSWLHLTQNLSHKRSNASLSQQAQPM